MSFALFSREPHRPPHRGQATVIQAVCLRGALVAILASCAPSSESHRDSSETVVAAPDSVQTESDCEAAAPQPARGTRVIAVYFSCETGAPGALYPTYRHVPDTIPPVEAAITELLHGPTEGERTRGLRSLFGARTAGAVRNVERSARGDTIRLDFAQFPREVLDAPGARSFLAPGIMADVTWTVFRQFPDVDVIRLSFNGSERAFWRWLGGSPRAFSRADWERI